MKKMIALFLAFFMLLTLCACGRPKKPILRVAMSPDFPPMEFLDDSKTGQDRFVGFDVSLAKYLAQGLGMELEIVPMSLENCQDAVEKGEVDMSISGYSWLPQREERFNLSITYHAGDNSSNQVILTREENAAMFSEPDTFSGIMVGAQTASLQEWLVQQQLPDAFLLTYQDLDKGLQLLRDNTIQAMAVAEGNANAILASWSGFAKADFRFLISEERTDNLILMPKGADELTAKVNDLLTKAEFAGYYPQWYAQVLKQTGVELHPNDQGQVEN